MQFIHFHDGAQDGAGVTDKFKAMAETSLLIYKRRAREKAV
jgi:hypothetical protein